MLNEFYHYIIIGLEIIGVAIIIYGVIRVLIGFFSAMFHRTIKLGDVLTEIRMNLSQYLVLSLEFFIARDIVETLLDPGIEEIIILVVLVGLRTLLAFYIDFEIKHMEKRKLDKVFK